MKSIGKISQLIFFVERQSPIDGREKWVRVTRVR